MHRLFVLMVVCSALCAPAVVFAQSAPLQYYKDMTKAAGQADGLSVACGKANQATVDAHKAKIRQNFAPHGLSPASFDQFYDAAFKTMIAQARTNPAQVKQACARLANLGRR